MLGLYFRYPHLLGQMIPSRMLLFKLGLENAAITLGNGDTVNPACVIVEGASGLPYNSHYYQPKKPEAHDDSQRRPAALHLFQGTMMPEERSGD